MFAVGDAVGMCRFSTKLFNSASTAGYEDFAGQLFELTGEKFTPQQLDDVGCNINGIERLINSRLGLTCRDDTLPERWFEEEIRVGPFKGEKIDKPQFEALKARFYKISGLNSEGVPSVAWHKKLAEVVTGFALRVVLPHGVAGAPEGSVIIDQPLSSVTELREALNRRLPHAAHQLQDKSLVVSVNGEMILSNEKNVPIKNGDELAVFPLLGGG